MTSEPRRRAYLEALGLDVWLPKAAAPGPARLVVSGDGCTLLVCASPQESASRLAGDIGRALGDDVAWAWPDPGDGTESLDLAEAVEEQLFTGVLLFGQEVENRLFAASAPKVIGSARVLRAPGLQDLEVRGTAKQALWRLLSGHFVHLGWSHLFLNLAGLSLVMWLVGYAFDVLHWALITALSIAAIDAGLWLLDVQLDWYVGLSGLLHGLLAAGLFVGLARRDREALILAVFVLAKLGWEQLVGPLPGSESTSGGAVIVNAHLYGAAGGALGAVLCRRSARPVASI